MAQGDTTNETLVIRCDGVFDHAAAQRVLEAVTNADPETEIYVDLSHVREFHDHGVATLAQAAEKARRRISVRGLRQHQYRMLRYLGVDPAALDAGLGPRPPRVIAGLA